MFRHNALDFADEYRKQIVKRVGAGRGGASVAVAADLKHRAVEYRREESRRFRDQSANARYCETVKRAYRDSMRQILEQYRWDCLTTAEQADMLTIAEF